jgi:hypothetical protein
MVAGKKALVGSKANATSTLALECPSRVRSEGMSSHDSLQLPVSKRKVDELSSPDDLSEPSSRHPVQGNLFSEGPTAQSSTRDLAAESSRQIGPTEGGLAYAVAARHTGPQQPNGPQKPPAKG